jgi:hypothetical protein
MTTNKKIKNATSTEYDDIKFKSKLEVTIYKTLKEKGLNPLYECNKFILQEGFRPSKPHYVKGVCPKTANGYAKIIQITYTPDFTVEYNDKLLFIEAKGKQNDSYPIKRKLFLNYLDKLPNAYFMEVYSKKDLLESLKQFEQYEQSKK